MISTAATFILTVMSLFIYCQIALEQGKLFEKMQWYQSAWLTLYLCGTLMIIYYASMLTNEVSIVPSL